MVVSVGNLEQRIMKSEKKQIKFFERSIDKFLNKNFGSGSSLIYVWPIEIAQDIEEKIVNKYSSSGWDVQKQFNMIYDVGYAWKFAPANKYNLTK